MKKLKIIFSLLTFFLFCWITNAEITPLVWEEKDCYDLIKQYESDKMTWFSFYSSWTTSNDWLISVDFQWENTFTKKSYVSWNASSIEKLELFKYYQLLWNTNKDNFYEKEINFYDISKWWSNDFLWCSYIDNIHLKWDISEFKKWDATVVYTTTPEYLEIEEVEFNEKKWKVITKETIFKNRDWNDEIFKVYKRYIVPENEDLKGFYNLYDMVDSYKEFSDWYKLKFENTDPNSPLFKEVYNKDWIEIRRYFVWNKATSDQYWIRYRFVNGYNFMDDYANYKKQKVLEFLVNDKSPLAREITVILNWFDTETKTYIEPQIAIYAWVQFFLWERDLELDKIETLPYFKAEEQVAVNSFYKVSDIFETRHDYKNYVYKNIYNESNDDDEIFESLSLDLTQDFWELRNEYNVFKSDYLKVKESWKKSDYKKFVDKYYWVFWHDNIFKEDQQFKEDLVEKVVQGKEWNNNILYFVIVFFLIALTWTLFILKNRKK